MALNCTPVVDGGWGFFVVFGSFISYFIADGIAYSFGILFTELLDQFDQSHGHTAIIGAMVYGIPLLISPIVCALCTLYGCRKVGILGGILCCISFSSSAFAKSLDVLILTIGMIASIGLSMTYLSSLLIVTQYFELYRGIATGIAVTGSGLGAIIFPFFVKFLIKIYTWHGALLIIGAVCLHLVSAAMLYIPMCSPNTDSHDRNRTDIEEIQKLQQTNLNVYMDQPTMKSECKNLLQNMMNPVVLHNGLFILYSSSTFLCYLWIGTLYVYLVDWAKGQNVNSEDAGVFLLSVIGIGRVVGQLITGALGDHPKVGCNLLYAIFILCSGIATLVIPFCRQYASMVVVCAFFGLGISVTYSVQMMCIIELCGLEVSNSAFGMLQLVLGIATLLGTPLGGWLFDRTGTYSWSFYTAGTIIILSAVMLLPIQVKLLEHKQNLRKPDSEQLHMSTL